MSYKVVKGHLANPGNYTVLTNTFCLVGKELSRRYYKQLKESLPENFLIIPCTVGHINTIGHFIIANSTHIVVSSLCEDDELQHLRNSLPDSVAILRLSDHANCVGNFIVLNDKGMIATKQEMSLPNKILLDIEEFLNKEREPKIAVHRASMNNDEPCIGSFIGGCNFLTFFQPETSNKYIENATNTLNTNGSRITVNKGGVMVGKDIIMNDCLCLFGSGSTSHEARVIETLIDKTIESLEK